MTDSQARTALIGGSIVLALFIGISLIFLISGQSWVASATPFIVVVMGGGFLAFSLMAYHLGFRRNFTDDANNDFTA